MKIDLQNPDSYFKHRQYNPDTVGGGIIVVAIAAVIMLLICA